MEVLVVDAQIRETITRLFRQKKQMQDIREDDNFFELGVSSLTIIELQLSIEEALAITVPTSELMRLDTMKQWIDIYSARTSTGTVNTVASAFTT